LADIQSLEKRLEKLRRGAKASKDDALLLGSAEALIEKLSEGLPARRSGLEPPQEFNLLTAKPVIYVCNVAEADVARGNAYVEEVRELAASEGSEVVVISAKIEGELIELSDEEARLFLEDLGLSEPGLTRLIHKGYDVLKLISFLTAGEKEVRAWTVTRGTKAPQAAGVIHSDFEKGFIRAEVIGWDRLLEAGSIANARAKGWLRTEGKDYVVQDGDVMHFLFNV
jgi:GTP-binding protein YchF